MGLFIWLTMFLCLISSYLNSLSTANTIGDPYATIADDGSISVLESNSLCANAFLKQPTITHNYHINKLPMFYNFTARPNSPLSIVNVGAGTTGTSLIFQIFCAGFDLSSIHWGLNCHAGKRNYNWFKFFDQCIETRSKEIGCRSSNALAQTTYIYEALLNGQALMDTLKGDVTKARAIFADAFQQMNSFHMYITSTSTTTTIQKQDTKPPHFSENSSSLINLCLFDVRDRRQGAIDLVSLLDPLAASARCTRFTYEQGGCPYFNLSTMARFDRAVCIKPSRDGIKRLKIKVPSSICNNKTTVMQQRINLFGNN